MDRARDSRSTAPGDALTFRAVIEQSGKTATGIPVPAQIVERLGAGKRPAVQVTLQGYTYNMPAFAQHGTLVYFASMTHHIGFYPTASGIAAFQEELAAYAGTKGAVHVPLDRPLPLDLIQRIVRFRVAENRQKAADTDTARSRQARSPGQGA